MLLTEFKNYVRRVAYSFSNIDLQKETALSTTPEPIVVILREIRDIKTWIKSSLENIHGHSIPHCFKFQKNATGHVIMFYKNWSSDPWCDEQDAVKLLKVVHLFYKESCKPNDRSHSLVFLLTVNAYRCTPCCQS